MGGARRIRRCGSLDMRLPAFRLLFPFVIAGPDPAIHADEELARIGRKLSEPRVGMDHRVKPGGDEAYWLWQNSGADRVARTVFSFLPAQ